MSKGLCSSSTRIIWPWSSQNVTTKLPPLGLGPWQFFVGSGPTTPAARGPTQHAVGGQGSCGSMHGVLPHNWNTCVSPLSSPYICQGTVELSVSRCKFRMLRCESSCSSGGQTADSGGTRTCKALSKMPPSYPDLRWGGKEPLTVRITCRVSSFMRVVTQRMASST